MSCSSSTARQVRRISRSTTRALRNSRGQETIRHGYSIRTRRDCDGNPVSGENRPIVPAPARACVCRKERVPVEVAKPAGADVAAQLVVAKLVVAPRRRGDGKAKARGRGCAGNQASLEEIATMHGSKLTR